jgi:hypothetical protein
MTAPNPKVVETVTAALVAYLQADETGYVRDDGDGDFAIDVHVNLPSIVAALVEIGQTPVDRVLAARKRRDAIKIPDRDDLAFELFAADNSKASREHCRDEFERLKREQAAAGETFYIYPLADAAIEQFRKANS